ncbi:MAG: hypothetical protein ACTSRZ_11835 [Promethearchaeota archaeon]
MQSPKNGLDKIDRIIIRNLYKDARVSLKKAGKEINTNHTTMYNH